VAAELLQEFVVDGLEALGEGSLGPPAVATDRSVIEATIVVAQD
jgi:hypothetical protein